MKSATIMASDVLCTSGSTCLSAARWCEGECSMAQEGKCMIWEAGDCTATATVPVRTRHIALVATDADYMRAVQLLHSAGFEVR